MSSTSCCSEGSSRAISHRITTHCVYAKVAAAECPNLDLQLGYILGKTLGSGTYAKVKAAWSKRHQNLVSSCIYNIL